MLIYRVALMQQREYVREALRQFFPFDTGAARIFNRHFRSAVGYRRGEFRERLRHVVSQHPVALLFFLCNKKNILKAGNVSEIGKKCFRHSRLAAIREWPAGGCDLIRALPVHPIQYGPGPGGPVRNRNMSGQRKCDPAS